MKRWPGPPGRLGWGAARHLGAVEQTTQRLRELVDGIEAAVLAGDELQMSQYVVPEILAVLITHAKSVAASGERWEPAREGLRWAASKRRPGGPGRIWLRVRFEDLTRHAGGERQHSALGETKELELDVETALGRWRLWGALEVEPR